MIGRQETKQAGIAKRNTYREKHNVSGNQTDQESLRTG